MESLPHFPKFLQIIDRSPLGLGKPTVVQRLSPTHLKLRLDLTGPTEIGSRVPRLLLPSAIPHGVPELNQKRTILFLLIILATVPSPKISE